MPTPQEKWTAEELAAEWKYRFEERVGILADGRTANDRQIQMAKMEADRAVEGLRRG